MHIHKLINRTHRIIVKYCRLLISIEVFFGFIIDLFSLKNILFLTFKNFLISFLNEEDYYTTSWSMWKSNRS